MRRIFAGIIVLMLSVAAVMAVPAYPGLIVKTYPDGSSVSYYIRGDEHFSYIITEDGYLLAENQEGVLEYGRMNARGYIEPTGVKASDAVARSAAERDFLQTAYTEDMLRGELRALHTMSKNRAEAKMNNISSKAYPLKDSPKSLVILANFKDVKFKSATAREDFEKMLNEDGYSVGGSLGSARDYFKTSSSGVFSPEFVVYGPVDLPQGFAYYGEDVDGSAGQGGHDKNPGRMIVQACNILYESGVDLKQFDTDNNGVIDNVFVFYAGGNQADGSGSANTIWPHRSVVRSEIDFDGVSIYDYACSSELSRKSRGSEISMCGIGTFCHEFGHVLGLSDLYETTYEHKHATVGSWDIMDHGSYSGDGMTPPLYSSFARFYLGWLKPTPLTDDGDYLLDPLVLHNTAYIVSAAKHNLNGASPSPNEYFLLENRQSLGMDAASALPATGLLIWHINFNSAAWHSNTPNNDPDNMGVMVYAASGNTGYPAGNVYPGSTNKTTCSFVLKNGTELPQPLSDIQNLDNIISFRFGYNPDATHIAPSKPIDDFVSYFGVENEMKTVEFRGVNVVGNVSMVLNMVHKSDFKIRLHTEDGSGQFSDRVTVAANDEDSTLSCKIDILFDPKELTYDSIITDNIVISASSPKSYRTRIQLRGQSKRYVSVIPPVAYEASDVAAWSYRAVWNTVHDATGYYLTSYTIDNTESSETENFTDFAAGLHGWRSTFNTFTNQYKSSAPCAANFKTSADTIWTKEFFMPVSKIAYWFQSVRAEGELFVDAKAADGSWVNVSAEKFGSTTVKNISVELDADNEYREFRIYVSIEKEGSGLAFDDFTTYYSKHLIYQLQDHFVAAPDTSYIVPNLTPGTEYYYTVRATDKDLEYGRYENITDESNEIEVTTSALAENVKERTLLIVGSKETKTYRAYVDSYEEGYSLFIYTRDGELVTEIPATSNEFVIPELNNGVLYVLKYAKKGDQKRKTRVGKLIYGVF